MRFYLSNTASDISPSPALASGTGWNDTVGYFPGALTAAPAGTSASKARAETSTSATWRVLLGSWVTAPLRATTISAGMVPAMGLQATNAGATNKFQFSYRIWVVTPAGVERGIIRNAVQATFDWGLTATGIVYTGITIPTPLAIEDGDRVVAELGYRATNTAGGSITGTMFYGGDATGTDIDNGDTSMVNTRAWLDLPVMLAYEPGRQLVAA